MKNTKRMLSMVLVLVFMFTVVMASGVFAGTSSDKGNGKGAATETEKAKGNDKANANTVEGKDKAVTTEGTVETEQEKAVKEKDKVMEEKKLLMKQMIEAKKAGNTEEAAKLAAEVKAFKEQLKKMVRESYTTEEMTQLQAMTQTITSADPTLEVLPVDSIITEGTNLKLDVPPVIKDGKVLVPVRAFSQAYGAEVGWNAEEHTITITKEGVEIVIEVGSNTALVNGMETDLGLPVKGINGRNVMPVGFLAAKLGLKAEVDPEDGTIEIEDGEDTTTETPAPTPTPTPTPAPTGTTTGN